MRKSADLFLSLFYAAVLFLYCFEALWDEAKQVLYMAIALCCVCVGAYCVISGRLYRNRDTRLLAAFLALSWVSALYNYGFSAAYFETRFFFVWAFLLCGYFCVQTVRAPERFLLLCTRSGAAGFAIVNACCLLHATLSLTSPVPGRNTVLGCFELGRLCALGNANLMGFSCCALVLLSIYGALREKGKRRLFYAPGALLGWFNLGLTNFRAGMLCVSLAVGLLVFSLLYRRSVHCLAAVAAAVLAAGGMLASLYLPLHLYRGVLRAFPAHFFLTEHSFLPRALSDSATLGDRNLIARTVLREIFRSPRRFWLGISSVSETAIRGVYPGHHEILIAHAHNTYLEIFRRFGVFALALLLWLLVLWCRCGLRLFFDKKASGAAAFLMAIACVTLVMGLVEQMPFPIGGAHSLSIPFFLICGYAARTGRNLP